MRVQDNDVTPDFVLDMVKDDPDDSRVLECAVTGSAGKGISGGRIGRGQRRTIL
jgi:hypothetical protein